MGIKLILQIRVCLVWEYSSCRVLSLGLITQLLKSELIGFLETSAESKAHSEAVLDKALSTGEIEIEEKDPSHIVGGLKAYVFRVSRCLSHCLRSFLTDEFQDAP